MRIAMISKSAHSASHRAALTQAGFDVIDLDGNPTSIPDRADMVVCRPQSCSHGASSMALKWARAKEGRRGLCLLADGLTQIVEWAVAGRVKMEKSAVTGAKPNVQKVAGAMRYLFRTFGFISVGMADWMTLEDVVNVAGLLESADSAGFETADARQALITLTGGNLGTQRRRLTDFAGGRAVFFHNVSARTGPLLRDSTVRHRLATCPHALDLLRVPGREQVPLAEPLKTSSVVLSAASHSGLVLEAVSSDPVIAEEEPVPEAAAPPPLPEAREETDEEIVDRPMDTVEKSKPLKPLTPVQEVEEAIRLLHSYMKDAGVHRIVLTPDSAEVTRTFTAGGTLNFGEH
jgi:hypothetical protein